MTKKHFINFKAAIGEATNKKSDLVCTMDLVKAGSKTEQLHEFRFLGAAK